MTTDNRANQPDSGPALWSYADECLARLQATLRPNNDEQRSIADLEQRISDYERKYGMSTFTFLKRWKADEMEDTAETNRWCIIASALGYGAPLERGPQPYRVNVASTETPVSADGGVREAVSVISEPVETAHELELVESEIDALSVLDAETVPPTSETTSPRETHGQTDTRPRPKGMTKLRSKVWDWIEQHAGPHHNTDTLSVNKVKAGAGCARGVAGEMLALYRSWYTDTSQKSA